MGPEGTGLYGWTPEQHVSRLDSDIAHRRLARVLRHRRLAAVQAEPHHGLMFRFGEWLGRVDHQPVYSS